MSNEWGGYGDSIDCRKINIEAPGSYNFTLSGLTVGSPAKFTLYSILTDKDGNETSLKALKTFTVSKTESGTSGILLLESGAYYVTVEAQTCNSKILNTALMSQEPHSAARFHGNSVIVSSSFQSIQEYILVAPYVFQKVKTYE
jgi:hypothetical protein